MKAFPITFSLLLLVASCDNSNRVAPTATPEFVRLPSGLQYRIIQEGVGPSVQLGDTVWIRETARYLDSTVLYSNESSHSPIPVWIGGGQATEGEDIGMRGMKKGEIREMIIPPSLSRRKSYPPNLSPDSTIAVTVILDSIQ